MAPASLRSRVENGIAPPVFTHAIGSSTPSITSARKLPGNMFA